MKKLLAINIMIKATRQQMALEIIKRCRIMGVTLKKKGTFIIVSPPSKTNVQLFRDIHEYLPELLELIKGITE